MRTLRMASVAFAILVLAVGSTVGAAARESVIDPVAGTFAVERLPGGTFDVEDRMFQYREFPLAGSAVSSDLRFSGDVEAELNWDVLATRGAPVPSWGTMEITVDPESGLLGLAELVAIAPPQGQAPRGAWTGTMSGIQREGDGPIELRAFLIGDGAFEGLCATLDIDVSRMLGGGTWAMDGIVHPLPEAG